MDEALTKDVFDVDEVHVLPEVDISAISRKYLDIVYAQESKYQKLDLFLPENAEEPFPLIVFIHGGGWRRGDKRDLQIRGFLKLLQKGYAVASINWRMSFEASFPACIWDVKAAIRYLKANAETYKIDANRFAVAGGSAGGHLALLVATTGGRPLLENLEMGNADQSSSVKCAVALFPATDFSTEFKQAEENEKAGLFNSSDNSRNPDDPDAPEAKLLGGAMNSLSERTLLEASPMYYISDNMAPSLLQHGAADYIIPCQQSLEFYKKAREHVGEEQIELDIFATAVHMDPQFQTDRNMDRIEAFISKHMRKKLRSS